jgi:hypothetical protein
MEGVRAAMEGGSWGLEGAEEISVSVFQGSMQVGFARLDRRSGRWVASVLDGEGRPMPGPEFGEYEDVTAWARRVGSAYEVVSRRRFCVKGG